MLRLLIVLVLRQQRGEELPDGEMIRDANGRSRLAVSDVDADAAIGQRAEHVLVGTVVADGNDERRGVVLARALHREALVDPRGPDLDDAGAA